MAERRRPRQTGASNDVAALAAGLVTVTLWGSSFVAIRDAGQTLSPGSLALGRLLVSLVVLTAAASIWRQPLPGRRDLLGIAAFGVLFLGVYSVTLNEAERLVDAGTAAMLINIGPLLIAIGAGIFLDEGFPRRLYAGCALAFSGCVVIAVAGSQSSSRAGLGIALLILAAFAYATAVVIQKPVLARVSPLQVTWLGCAAGAVVCLPFAPTLVGELDNADATAIGWTVYLGVAPTSLGFATWAYALRHTNAGRLASLAYLIPVVALLLGWAFLGETPPRLAVIGGTLCLAGVILARRRQPPAAHRQTRTVELAAARQASRILRTRWRQRPRLRLPNAASTSTQTGHDAHTSNPVSLTDAADATGTVSPRLAVPGDVHEIVRLRQLMFDSMGITSNDSTWLDAAEQHLTRELAGDHTVAVVVDAPSGGLAGCGVIEIHQRIPSPSNPRGRIGYVSTVSTDPAWQRRGIATTVLARLIAEAEHRAIPRIELHATPDGIDLYRASGFVDRQGGREMRRDTEPIHLSRL